MGQWHHYPDTYRRAEVQAVAQAAKAGECCAIAGLSGSGKSNLLGFIANRLGESSELLSMRMPGSELPGILMPHPAFVLVDCNRLPLQGGGGGLLDDLFSLVGSALGAAGRQTFESLQCLVGQRLQAAPAGLCLLFDRFEALAGETFPAAASSLRALRDLHKYDLTYVIAARRPPDPHSELAELFYAHTLWLGPLRPEDARWTAARYAQRLDLPWETEVIEQLVEATGGYPAFLRAACEAVAAGCPPRLPELAAHPAVQRRLAEFLADQPGPAELSASRLAGLPLLALAGEAPASLSPAPKPELTAKEHLLWSYFQAHPRQVCEKDELIRAIWPEELIFKAGIRDDSLAQLVRRLREKVETDPSHPHQIHTVPGRGYRFEPVNDA